jgi:hypothetical protein
MIIALIPVVLLLAYCLTQHPKIAVNSEYAKLMLLRGGYRSWTIYWSDGLRLNPDGTTTNLWRWPTFAHADVRRLNIHTEKAK